MLGFELVSQKDRYWASFLICAFVCLLLQTFARYGTRTSSSNSSSTTKSNSSSSSNSNENVKQSAFLSFQTNYLIVFMLAMFSDWLQGPYVYELYVSYGFTQAQIAELFVCGFASSMIVGTFVGSLADKWGRKLMCIMYSIFYIVACCTKLFPNYWILMFGRFLSGISTSLLFSVFESWMVCEHHKNGYDGYLLGDTFSYATFGNGLVAVGAGLIANYVADSFGYVSPFIVAMFPLALVGIITSLSWNENYGNQTIGDFSSLLKGFNYVMNDSKIAALGLAQSIFEGAMYTFVFMWTPALKSIEETTAEREGKTVEDSTSESLGIIFAVFMVCVMIGSTIFKLVSSKREILYALPLFVHSIALIAMFVTATFITHKMTVYCMFLLFETVVGIFYPSYGVIKSEKVPEDIRSAMMNIFRIPLNFFVVILLLKIDSLSPETIFIICTLAHFISLLCYYHFYKSIKSNVGNSAGSV